MNPHKSTPCGLMASLLLLLPCLSAAQQPCATGIRIEGTVTDPTGAAIPNARIKAATGEEVSTDATGQFTLPCVSSLSITITAQATGFSSATATATGQPGETAHLNLQLALTQVNTDVQVNAAPTAMDPDNGAGSRTLSLEEVQQLPDDPDDLMQQLQILASAGGGAVSAATIVVDGFQNGSALPPKDSIASIRINPDPFSPEYEHSSSDGGRVEIFTKPGADSFHGSIFITDSESAFNATDPFSVTSTPASKRRYGFDLSGPLLKRKSGFALSLEKRDINEFNIVNAITLDPSGNQTPLQQSVAAPQHLWIASARNDWQLTPRDVATISFAANVNNLSNQGAGGLTLAEAGYSSLVSEYDLRFTNSLTLSANLLHETRIGYTWKRTQQTPLSSAPSLQVAGFFTGGGATSQNLNDRERDLEIDDDVMITHGIHSFKIGAQSLGFFVHNYDPDTFNGAYVFGGGSAPVLDANNNPTGQTTTITGIEQYRRALLSLPGGTPTTYQLTTGTPLVPFTRWSLALYVEDIIKLTPRLTISTGLRYALQTAPTSLANFTPRFAASWSIDKNSTWVAHLRAGLFSYPINLSYPTQVYRLNGTRQQQRLVYSPDYNNPLAPTPGSIAVSTIWQFPHTFQQLPAGTLQVGIEHDFPHHWHPSLWYTWASEWADLLARNINAPLVADSIGTAPDPTAALLAPRPITPNENIFQYQNAAHLGGGYLYAGIKQNSFKHFTLNLGYWYANFHSDAGWSGAATPQSTYSRHGESSRPDNQTSGGVTDIVLKLPLKLELSVDFSIHYNQPYNITTGTDANGDGTFNDRPSYASAPGAGVYSTHYGLLTTNTVNGNIPRNLGTMPSLLHTYANLSRTFKLNKDTDHPRTLVLNFRSSNVINHTNPTAVGTIVSSPSFGQAITAETARRAELGARFTF